MLIQISNLVDDAKCDAGVRQLRWPEGVRCPQCDSAQISKRGFHSHQKDRQRYACQACQRQFDDLTETLFEGHHQPLKVWGLCLYLLGLNVSNAQIAAELDRAVGEAHGLELP